MPDKTIAERILEDYGPETLAALQRAIGPYNDITYHSHLVRVGPERAARLAWHCQEAEDDAIHAMTQLRDWLDAEIDEVKDPAEPQDERRPYVSSWSGDSDEVIIALARLAEARNNARPAR